jgi:hypothetical protein
VYGFDMSCIRQVALQEPLVDVVNCNQAELHNFLIPYAEIKLDILKFLSGSIKQ